MSSNCKTSFGSNLQLRDNSNTCSLASNGSVLRISLKKANNSSAVPPSRVFLTLPRKRSSPNVRSSSMLMYLLKAFMVLGDEQMLFNKCNTICHACGGRPSGLDNSSVS